MGAVDHYTHQIDDARDTRKHHRHENALGKKNKKIKIKGIENITVIKMPPPPFFFFVPGPGRGGGASEL